LLNKLNGRAARFRISMYTDDAVIFLKLTVKDVSNLKLLLEKFVLVTRLQTNLQKTSVSAISCSDIDLDELLTRLPVARAHFLIKYLGLPLSTRRLRRVDFQPRIDKAT
jgi:hypothetical protein